MASIWKEICISPSHPHLKTSGIIHTHTQSMWEFPVKTGTGSSDTHEYEFIYHLYVW